MAVRIRMKKLGRKHRPFYRICVMDARSPRDGAAIEELGTYDPMVPETDARVVLNHERVSYWLNVGAQPTHKTGVLIKKYGPEGTHLEQQAAAREKLAMPKIVPPVEKAVELPKNKGPEEAAAAEGGEATAAADGGEAQAEGGAEASATEGASE